MQTITRTTCRLCGGSFKTVINLGELYVSDYLVLGQTGIKAPLELVLCDSCELLQLKHTAPMELMYARHYWYQSKLNPKIVNDLKEIVDKVFKIKNFRSGHGGIWIDVGSNDGALLDFVDSQYVERIGVEPASNLTGEGYTEYKCFWEDFNVPGCHADVITAIGMFYDAEDPIKFVSNVTKHLADDGIFIAQLMTLTPMVEASDLGNICHEHLEYYSYKTLKYLFEESGLEIFKVEENDINGGSYRLFARKYKTGSIDYPEPKFDYEEFAEALKQNKILTVDFIRAQNTLGKKVYGYGASTKGNTILQYYGLTKKDIPGVIDPHPEKQRKLCVGSNIPVVGEEHIKKADYLFILPWAFTDNFIKQESERGYGGKFIVSIPNFKVI